MLMKIIKLYFLMALALLSGGCKGWLTIDSSDRIMENTLFETEEGFFTALNGVYAELPQASLYGKSLAAVTFDVQAQYFDTTQPSTHTFNTLGAYSAEARKTAVADTWDKAYFVIANVNKILEHCESDRDVLSDRAYHIIRGEMLGMRALLHFEMLRIFGPVFAEAPARVSIPYRTSSELTVTPLLPANEVAEKIAGDFTDALSELADWDPVRTEGRLNGETTGSVRLPEPSPAAQLLCGEGVAGAVGYLYRRPDAGRAVGRGGDRRGRAVLSLRVARGCDRADRCRRGHAELRGPHLLVGGALLGGQLETHERHPRQILFQQTRTGQPAHDG